MDIFSKDINELIEMIESDQISAEQLILSHIEQIESNDNDLKAYITINKEDAINKGKEIEKKKNDGIKLGALAGIPMAVSDDISTKNIRTTLNSKMLDKYIPSFDATVIEKLKREDTVLLGKTNIREFGVGKSDNPWGTATAVANNEAIFGIASDTTGEVRQSAAANFLYGLKPTYGLVSRFGLIGSAPSFEQIGIIAKKIEDISKVFKIVKGKDSKDSTSLDKVEEGFFDDLKGNLKGINIALPKEYFEDDMISETISTIKMLGANVEYVSIPSLKYVLQVYEIISSGEFSSNMGKFDGLAFGYRTSDFKDIDELYKKSRSESFGEDVKKKIIFGNFVLSSDQYIDFYEQAQRVRGLIIKEFKEVFNRFDVILTPVLNKRSDLEKDLFTVSANVVGLPALVMPTIDNSNVGIQLIGPAFSENKLFAIGAVYSKEKKMVVKK